LGAVAAIAAVIAAWDAELKAHVGAIEVHADRGLLAGIECGHAIDDGLRKGRALGSVVAGRSLTAIHPVAATRNVEGEAHVRASKLMPTAAGVPGSTVLTASTTACAKGGPCWPIGPSCSCGI
jgi:hypothetical protein